jgi:hypothetical protein
MSHNAAAVLPLAVFERQKQQILSPASKKMNHPSQQEP